MIKNLPANAGDVRDVGSISGSGRSPGGGLGNPLQFSCLENPMGRDSWWDTIHGVAKNQTQLNIHACHMTEIKSVRRKEQEIKSNT